MNNIVISLKLLMLAIHHDNYLVDTVLSFNIIINQLRKRSGLPTTATDSLDVSLKASSHSCLSLQLLSLAWWS